MEGEAVDRESIEARLAALEEHLAFIREEMVQARARRLEAKELKEDLSRIAKDVFDSAVVELEEVAPFVETGDFLHLAKKVLRNVKNLSRLFERLEGAVDFFEDFKPVGKEIFGDILAGLDEMEKKGYFALISGFLEIMDALALHFTPERVRMVAGMIPDLAALAEEAAASGAAGDLRRAVAEWNQGRRGRPRSLLGLLAALRSPGARRCATGLLAAMEALGGGDDRPER